MRYSGYHLIRSEIHPPLIEMIEGIGLLRKEKKRTSLPEKRRCFCDGMGQCQVDLVAAAAAEELKLLSGGVGVGVTGTSVEEWEWEWE